MIFNIGGDYINMQWHAWIPSSSTYSMKYSSNPAKISRKFRIETLSPSTIAFPEMCERSTLRTSAAIKLITVWQFLTCCSAEMGFSIMPVWSGNCYELSVNCCTYIHIVTYKNKLFKSSFLQDLWSCSSYRPANNPRNRSY